MRDRNSTQNIELEMIAQWKTSIKSMRDNDAFCGTCEEELKGEIAEVTAGSK